ncbi:MAG: anti-sigma factor domain-containing protein [Planctomycetota bacterium]
MAKRATEGLDPSETRDFERLASAEPGTDVDALDYAAAALQLAYLEVEPLPREVADRIPLPARRPAIIHRTALHSRMGWVAAAAILVLAVLLWPRTQADAPFDEAKAARLNWSPVDAKGRFGGVSGEVVWNESSQRGYMLLRGLPVNDPQVEQYQLWIVDGRKDRYKHPVDGGVFDCASAREIRVPIDAKLRVERASTFVLTSERPGGVVVSDGPFLVVAAN